MINGKPIGRFICIGTVTIDRSYRVSKVVDEGEAVNCCEFQEAFGGKGLNQVIALKRAGAQPLFYTKVGKRDYDNLKKFFEEMGLCGVGISPAEGHTNHGVIQITPQGRTAIIGVSNPEVSFTMEEMDGFVEELSAHDILILQNEIDSIPYLMKAANAKGCTIVLNPSPLCENMAEWPLECVDILILNEMEGQALSGKKNVEDILTVLTKRCGGGTVILTLGEEGSIYQRKKERIIQPRFQVRAVDTIAAGDTFAGYFLAVYMETGSAVKALSIAAKAAAIVVSRFGAAKIIPERAEVERIGL